MSVSWRFPKICLWRRLSLEGCPDLSETPSIHGRARCDDPALRASGCRKCWNPANARRSMTGLGRVMLVSPLLLLSSPRYFWELGWEIFPDEQVCQPLLLRAHHCRYQNEIEKIPSLFPHRHNSDFAIGPPHKQWP